MPEIRKVVPYFRSEKNHSGPHRIEIPFIYDESTLLDSTNERIESRIERHWFAMKKREGWT